MERDSRDHKINERKNAVWATPNGREMEYVRIFNFNFAGNNSGSSAW